MLATDRTQTNVIKGHLALFSRDEQKCLQLPSMSDAPQKDMEELARAVFTVPIRYEDRRRIHTVGDLMENETFYVSGTVQHLHLRAGKKTSFLEATVRDDAGVAFQVLWFHFTAYQQKLLEPGNRHIFVGKPKWHHKVWSFANPGLMERSRMGKIVPVYRKEGKEKSEKVGERIRLELKKNHAAIPDLFPETLPAILESMELPPLITALRDTHWPNGLETAYQAQETLKVAEIVRHIHRLALQQEKRRVAPRPGMLLTEIQRNHLMSALPFSLSPSQNAAWATLEKAFAQPQAQAALILGGVGSGKSAIAFLSALTQVMDSAQEFGTALLIAPTVVLARQLWENLEGIAQKLGVPARLHGRDRMPKAGDEPGGTSKRTIWVGTHGLLNAIQDWNSVGLVVFDEEHRYGKDTKTIPSHVHRLLMSATPIPNTLAHQRFGNMPILRLQNDHHARSVTSMVLTRNQAQPAIQQIRQSLARNRKAIIVYSAVQIRESRTVPERFYFLHSASPGDKVIAMDRHRVLPGLSKSQKADPRMLACALIPYAEATSEESRTPFYRLNKEFSARKILESKLPQRALVESEYLVYDKEQPDRLFAVPESVLRQGKDGTIRRDTLRSACRNELLESIPLIRASDLMQGKSLESARNFWEEQFPDQVAVVHGQLSGTERDAALAAFRDGQRPLLVASSIVEVGIDVQGAETIVVADADRMGVASLAQLRGRVGRHGEPGYCFFLGPEHDPDAMKRLRRIAEENNEEKLAIQDFLERGFGAPDKQKQSGNTSKLFRLPRDAHLFLTVSMRWHEISFC